MCGSTIKLWQKCIEMQNDIEALSNAVESILSFQHTLVDVMYKELGDSGNDRMHDAIEKILKEFVDHE